jgi:hypothetical protein
MNTVKPSWSELVGGRVLIRQLPLKSSDNPVEAHVMEISPSKKAIRVIMPAVCLIPVWLFVDNYEYVETLPELPKPTKENAR